MYQKGRVSAFLSIILIVVLISPSLALSANRPEQDLAPMTTPENIKATGFPPGWTDDIQLTFIPGLGSNAMPTIATNGDIIHVVWNNNTDGQLGYCRSEDAGRTWTEPRVITSGNVAWDARIAVNGSHVHLVYGKDYVTSFEIVYQNSTDNGKTWNAPVMLTPSDGIKSQLADIAIDDGGNIHIVWEDWGGGMEIMYCNSTDGGISWNPTIQLTNYPGGSDATARIVANGSVLHVVWGRYVTASGSFETMYLRSLDGGSTWEAEKQITKPGSGHSYAPDLAVNGSSVYAIWMDSRNGAWETYINTSFDDGVTWNGGICVTDIDGRNSFGAHVGVWTETVYVVWGDPRDDYPYPEAHEAYMNYSLDGGVTWQTSNERLQFALNNSGPKDIVLTENYIHVVMKDNRTGKREIYYKRYPDFPADTTPPTITHTPVTGTPIGQTINITAQVSDNVALEGVWLNYTGVNGTNYNVSMIGWDQKMVMVSGLGQTLYAQDGNYSFVIPAQETIGLVDYFIWCNDTSGNANITIVYQIQINDVTDPEINHIPVASANVFDTMNITANITDDVSVDSVFLNYTGVNSTNYNVSMNKWNGNWSYDIPGQASTGNVDYFIWANDTSDNDNMTAIYQIQINDITKPEINHVPVISVNIGEIINITTNITDDVSVNKAFLNYTDIHDVNQNITMNQWDGNYSFDIPSQSNSGFVNYFIWANDSSYNDNMTQMYQIQIFDIIDPVINHAPILSANISEIINITANVTDDVSVNSVFLNYTGVNGTNFNVSIQKWNGNYSYEISGQNTIGTVQYFIWANDTNGNNNRTIDHSIQVNDVVKPEINHSPVTTTDIGETIIITANVTDDVGIDTVYLNYTDVDGTVHNVSMSQGSDWSYTIPGQSDIGFIDYFVWANDTSGNDNLTGVYQIQIIDVVKPEIEHEPVTSANISEVINITAVVSDDVEVNTVYLNYTDINGVNHNISMALADGSWSYNIPGQASAGAIEYFIWTNDTSDNDNRTEEFTIEINEIIIPDTTPPTIISNSPTGVNVSISTTITIAFDEPMNTTSAQNAIIISPSAEISSFSWSNENQTVVLSLSVNLSNNTTYNVTIGTGAKDLAGNSLANAYSWEFTTELETITNGHDDWLAEYWWVLVILIVAVIVAVWLFIRFRKEKDPEE